MPPVLMTAAYGNPVIQLVDLGTGEVTPVPSELDGDSAFDHPPVPRADWVAVRVGYKVAAFRDGTLLRSTTLPDAWQICPAMNPELLWIQRYLGRSRRPGEEALVELVDADGRVHRSGSVPLGNLVGEVESGLVFNDGIWTSDGEVQSLSVRGNAWGVVGEDWVVLPHPEGVAMVSVSTGRLELCATEGLRSSSHNHYSASARRLTFSMAPPRPTPLAQVPDDAGVLVMAATQGPELVLSSPEVRLDPVQIGEGSLLAARRSDNRAGLVDIATGEFTPLAPVSVEWPRLDVTGRFDPEEVRSVLRPTGWHSPTRAERHAALSQMRASLRDGASYRGGRWPEEAEEAVRLRMCLAPKRIPLGASRFGGRPDMGRGHSWPSFRGTPMAFIGQIRMEDLDAAAPEGVFVKEGLLSIFVAVETESSSPIDDAVKVVVSPEEGLRRLPWPAKLPMRLRYRPELILPEPMLSLPGNASLSAPVGPMGGPRHQVLGHPYSIQDPAPPESPFGAMRLLVQVDEDSLTGFDFGDAARLHIWVPVRSNGDFDLDHCVATIDSY